MISYCLKSRKTQKVKIEKLLRQKTEEWCFYQNAQCDSVKSKIIKEQDNIGLLIILGIKTPLNKIPLVCPLLF